MFTRRQIIQNAGLLMGFAASGAFAANAFANTESTGLVVPFPAGGGGDVLARSVAGALAEELGTKIWVDNRPGAGGTIGARHLSRARADGSMLGYVTNGILCVNPLLYPNVPFNPREELRPAGMISEIGLVGVLNPNAIAGVTDLKSLVAWAKAHPKEVNFASSGIGTTSHLAGLLFARRAGLELTHVPYRGGAAAMLDVLSGRIPFMIDVAPNALQHVRSGKLTALGAASKQRLAIAPDIPTFAEAGVADVELSAWDGIVLPKGAPDELVSRVSAALARALKRPEVVASLSKKGAEPRPGTSADFIRFIESETPKWAELVAAIQAETSQ
ncbi:tripartite tricarboxylate transporter substrate binding protein [uncultured Sutterella sp.]|uniref:Bug family tripartite tricarboxylate transporter substrate binding protein n=1 Tax=uncultured Sutterella sp. TaxID=286133 RepID=UPI002616D811|nr:tripartite tricarboxylate transporter substrate binding protein [uncultured Sutterella sp.]